MPSSYLNFPFDPELFLMQWQAAQDPTLTAMLQSMAVQRNGAIQSLIANGSDLYTIPFYNVLGGTPDNYDGQSDITTDSTTGASQSGVVFGRSHSWKAQDFVVDFNSGADPMRQITSQVARFWQKKRQDIMLGILKGVFSVADDSTDNWDKWQQHVYNIAAQSGTVSDANLVGATSAGDAIQKAVGDNSGIFSMAWMHSKVANRLAGLQLLQFRKYTDPSGITRQLSIADYNGLTVVVDDGCPVADSANVAGEKEYTTYLMGTGALQTAVAPVKTPVETGREPLKAGGYDYIVTRLRETIHPNGFTFTPPATGFTHSPTNAQLSDKANWKLCGIDPKTINMAALVTNG